MRAGSHEINHNDEFDWYYSSLRVADAGQPFYRGSGGDVIGSAELLTFNLDVKTTTAARCCSRRSDDAPISTEPCQYFNHT